MTLLAGLAREGGRVCRNLFEPRGELTRQAPTQCPLTNSRASQRVISPNVGLEGFLRYVESADARATAVESPAGFLVKGLPAALRLAGSR